MRYNKLLLFSSVRLGKISYRLNLIEAVKYDFKANAARVFEAIIHVEIFI